MSIRLKIVVSIAVVFILGIAALGFFLQEFYDTRVDAATRDALRTASTAFSRLEAAETDKLASTLLGLQSNAAFREPFIAHDRAALYTAARPVFDGLKAEHGITHWYFESLPDSGTVFLRVHKPEQFGDMLGRKTYVAASTGETQSAGLELGKTAVALRVVHPYRDADGNLIGYMELGREIDGFLEAIKAQTGDEVGLLLLKKSMDASGWADVAKQRGHENTWDENEDFVLAGATRTELSKEIREAKGLAAVGESGKALGVFPEDGEIHARLAFPLNDAAGDQIGLVYVEHDITGVVDEIATTRARMMGAVVVMMATILIVVLLLLNGLIFKRLEHMITDMETISTRVAGGDYEVTYTHSGSDDEIGRFEDFYAEFIALVGGALKQLSDAMRK